MVEWKRNNHRARSTGGEISYHVKWHSGPDKLICLYTHTHIYICNVLNSYPKTLMVKLVVLFTELLKKFKHPDIDNLTKKII